MSVIGPRPALWNQDVLIAEREKYNANDVKPGLTGWAQINGRDELEIPVKAKLDGEYVEKESLLFDIKCFLGTIGKVAKDDSVVEGGTGEMSKHKDKALIITNHTQFSLTTFDLKKRKYIQSDIRNSIFMLEKEVRPDVVLVHGDTSTTFVTALACFYLQIPVGHVEAGLRTYDIYSPYPEEFNRQAVSIISKYNFAPTELSKNNLLKEGKKEETIYVTGNTAIDALKTTVRDEYTHPELEWAKDSRLILITAHRRENLGEPMKNMFRAIRRVIRIIFTSFAIHRNIYTKDLFFDLSKTALIESIKLFL